MQFENQEAKERFLRDHGVDPERSENAYTVWLEGLNGSVFCKGFDKSERAYAWAREQRHLENLWVVPVNPSQDPDAIPDSDRSAAPRSGSPYPGSGIGPGGKYIGSRHEDAHQVPFPGSGIGARKA